MPFILTSIFWGPAMAHAVRRQPLAAKAIPVAERSKARVCGRPLAGVESSNPARGMDVCGVLQYTKDKRQNQDKEVQIKYREQKKNSRLVDDLWWTKLHTGKDFSPNTLVFARLHQCTKAPYSSLSWS